MYGDDEQVWRVIEKFYDRDFALLGYPVVHSAEELKRAYSNTEGIGAIGSF